MGRLEGLATCSGLAQAAQSPVCAVLSPLLHCSKALQTSRADRPARVPPLGPCARPPALLPALTSAFANAVAIPPTAGYNNNIRKVNRPATGPAAYAPATPPSAMTPATPAPPAASPQSAPPSHAFPALHLTPLNDTFVPKQISLAPAGTKVKIGRQTNAKTIPNGSNGYFDSKVLSRMHAEVWSEDGKVRPAAPVPSAGSPGARLTMSWAAPPRRSSSKTSSRRTEPSSTVSDSRSRLPRATSLSCTPRTSWYAPPLVCLTGGRALTGDPWSGIRHRHRQRRQQDDRAPQGRSQGVPRHEPGRRCGELSVRGRSSGGGTARAGRLTEWDHEQRV